MNALRIWAGIAISLVALYFAFRDIHFADVGRALLDANYLWLVVSCLFVVASIAVRARRWRALFPEPERLHFGRLFGVLNVGYLINNILPLRAGELARVVLLGQVEDTGRVQTLSTILVERVVDTLAVIAMLAAVLPFVSVSRAVARPVLLLTVAMLLLVLVLFVAASRRATAIRLVEFGARFLPERFRAAAARHADAAIDGLAALTNPRAAVEVIGLTVLIYLLLAAAMETQLLAFQIHLRTAGPFFLLAAATLGLVVPSSPGAVGVWEGIVIGVLAGIFAIDRSLATSVALVSHVIFFAPPMLFAALYLWRLGASWSSVLSLGRAPAGESPTA